MINAPQERVVHFDMLSPRRDCEPSWLRVNKVDLVQATARKERYQHVMAVLRTCEKRKGSGAEVGETFGERCALCERRYKIFSICERGGGGAAKSEMHEFEHFGQRQ